MGKFFQRFEKQCIIVGNHRVDASLDARQVLCLEAVQKLGIFALCLKVVDQRFGIAFYFRVNQADVDVFFQEVVREQLHAIGCDFERLAEIALQRVDAGTAAVEVALHQAEKGFQLEVIVRFLHRVTVVNRRDQRPRAAQAVARGHIRGQKQAFIQIFGECTEVEEVRKGLVTSKIVAKMLQAVIRQERRREVPALG